MYGRALAQTAGTAVMRLADAELLPFDFDDLSDTVRRYVTRCGSWRRDAREHTVERNRQIDEGVFAAMEDPRSKTVPPKKEEVAPFLDFAPLDNGMAALQHGAEAYAQAMARISGASALRRGAARGQCEADRRGARADAQGRPAQSRLV